MATKAKSKATSTKAKAKEVEPEATEELDELEELEGDEVEETPTKKKADDVVFGAADLAKLLSEKAGKPVSTRELRTLIRKMARDGSARVNREIVPGNRTRYSWSGPEDPEVKAIIAAFDGGELEADKQAKLAELKENKAKKKAAKEAEDAKAGKGKKGKGKKAAEPVEPVEVEADDDDDDLELDEED